METDKHVQDLMQSITESLAVIKRFLLTDTVRPFSQGENLTDWCNLVLLPYCKALTVGLLSVRHDCSCYVVASCPHIENSIR